MLQHIIKKLVPLCWFPFYTVDIGFVVPLQIIQVIMPDTRFFR